MVSEILTQVMDESERNMQSMRTDPRPQISGPSWAETDEHAAVGPSLILSADNLTITLTFKILMTHSDRFVAPSNDVHTFWHFRPAYHWARHQDCHPKGICSSLHTSPTLLLGRLLNKQQTGPVSSTTYLSCCTT